VPGGDGQQGQVRLEARELGAPVEDPVAMLGSHARILACGRGGAVRALPQRAGPKGWFRDPRDG
jgi:hypothetical protein